MAEAYNYRRETVDMGNGRRDTALMRVNRGSRDWANATFRGTGANRVGRPLNTNGTYGRGTTNRVRRTIRTAAARSAARNPRMRTNR